MPGLAQFKKILIIEDDIALANSLSAFLSCDYEIILAATGEAGLVKAVENQPDLILLDITLPGKNGIEILKELKSNPQTDDIEVLVLTNIGEPEIVGKIFNAGGRQYLIKSDWSLDAIAKKIKEVI